MKATFTLFISCLATVSLNAANFITPGNPAYEPFANATSSNGTSYAVGAPLYGQTNAQGLAWVLAGTTNTFGQPYIANGTLNYSGLRVDSGNAAYFGGSATGNYTRWDFNSTFSGSSNQIVYYSMLLEVTSLGNVELLGTNGAFIACFNSSTGATGTAPSTSLGARLLIRTNGSLGGFNMGINKADGTGQDYYWSPAQCSLNTTYFVVGAYTFSGTPSSANDSVSIWVNPTNTSFGGNAPSADATSAGSANNGGANITAGSSESIASFLLRQDNGDEPDVVVAELSVGLTWADVTPLPILTPVFSNLTASTNTTYGTAVTLSGTLSAPGPVYPTNGDPVIVSVNGVQQTTTIDDSTGDFTINYNPQNTPLSVSPYTITYLYNGNSHLNLFPATNTSTTLTITNPLPVVLSGSEPYNGTATVQAGALYVFNAVSGDNIIVASGTGTLAATNAGPEPISSFGTLALGGSASSNYTLTGASGSVTITVSPVTAGSPIFEPFNDATASNGTSYAQSADLAGQTNAQGYSWYAAGSGAGGQPTMATPPVQLSISGLKNVSTNSVTYGGAAGISARLDLGKTSGTSTFTGSSNLTLYYSMPFEVFSLGGLSSTNAFVAGFNNSAGSQAGQPSVVGARLYTRLDGSGYDLGINKADGASGDIAWESSPYTVGTANFVIAAYTFSGTPGASNDSVSLWVNPVPSSFGAASAPTPDATTAAGPNIGSTSTSDVIASFLLREANADEPGIMYVGQVSVGSAWADVTPPAGVSVSPFQISASAAGGNIIINWPSVSGASYQVLATTNVTTPRSSWSHVGSPITATGSTTSATNPITPFQTFYGVVSP